MSQLATSCPQCGTSFRVTEAQLAASDGHVRCGRCDAVFNARDSLSDLDQEALRPARTPHPEPNDRHAASAADPSTEPDFTAPGSLDALDTSTDPTLENGLTPAAEPEPEPTYEPAAFLDSSHAAASDPDGRNEPAWDAELAVSAPALHREDPGLQDAPHDAESVDPASPGLTVPANAEPPLALDRMRALLAEPGTGSAPAPALPPGLGARSPAPAPAHATARWSSLHTAHRAPRTSLGRRLLVTTVALFLLLALPAQWAWIDREHLMARWPALARWTQDHWPAAAPQGWRHLEGLSVEASSLQPAPQGGALHLELTLHNTQPYPLVMPWLDLNLQDAQGKTVVRRALDARSLNAHNNGIEAPLQGGERRVVRATFSTPSAARITGYELGLFHP